ncbi:MAG TPA: DUF1552 domain-containing protein [Polyangiaceae bacterium]|nr:DUF1552 domain-containing protein [Polyangiaceae bacterium]
MNPLRKFRLDRRTVLRGVGSVAIALPWLEVMGAQKTARAQAQGAPGKAKRFLAVYQPGGTVAYRGSKVTEKFWPTTGSDGRPMAGPDGKPLLTPILEPLRPVFPKVLIPKGLSMTKVWHKRNGEQHQAGIVSLLTGASQPGGGSYPGAPSIDQVLAKALSKNGTSLQMAVRWATGTSNSKLAPQNALNFAEAAPHLPLPPDLDPQKIYQDLFMQGGGMQDAGADAARKAEIVRQQSILDVVKEDYQKVAAVASGRDRQVLEQHAEEIRRLELSLADIIQVGGACLPPAKVDTAGYNPVQGTSMSPTTDAIIPKVGEFMMDMMVMAMACDVTAVGSFQWTDTEAKHTFPWLNLVNHHHYYQHDGNTASNGDFVDGYAPGACEKICTWYSQMNAHLLSKMDGLKMSEQATLLDETLVFFGSELSNPPNHDKENMPFLLAGGGIGGGRVMDCGSSTPHNNLLVSIFNHFGDGRTTFGDAEFCQNPLPNLTA